MIPIYIGALRSRKLSPLWENKDDEDTEVKVISGAEAAKFPFVASGVLLSLYVAIKYVSPELVNMLISVYLTLIGAYCTKYYVYMQLKQRKIMEHPWKFKKMIRIPYFMPNAEALELTYQDFLAYFLVLPLAVLYFYTKNWVICDIFGVALSINALENMPIGSFMIGFGLLSALLFYDVFFVFGTDVMLTVAKNIDGPIKLLFPKVAGGFSMIGLGDIIMPGILITMTLRYDLFRLHKREGKGKNIYFLASFTGYALGICATLCAMLIMEREQPALLYLVPFTIVSILLTALVTGEFSQLWLYKEENSE
ncbi:hypothetical protein SteCoe_11656 [Stentor coeruleus]|uniref:Uncharacterized protein n=1 Tax=Stentor coeruleus TaxID=5963 RepID=A0A1R2CCR8_9CILI|nr:hypothetical protein SteCoe_11656 [Stentor coeruleus]